MHENDDPPQGSGDSVAGEFGNGDESNGQDDRETVFSDSKDDMFVDAPEELNFETPSKESVAKGDDNNGTLGVDEFKNGKETLDRELAGLQEQLTLLTGENDLSGQDGNIVVGSSLHEVVGQFSKFLENVKEERVQHENALRELQGIVNKKDSEITDLTAKISELSNSLDVASAAEVGYQAQIETIQQIEASVDRILFSLSAVFGQEELQYGSVPEKLTLTEYRVSLLSAKYTEFYYGIDQLKKCLSRDESELSMQEDFGSVLGAACSELFELKQKETVLFEKLSHLEEENTKLAEQVSKEREMIESINTEFGKTKADLEQERTRCANTKEKLSMAVTKGKALVQQRDALKQSLSERTTELENRLTELQEKKNALETSELMKGQLEQSLAEKTDELAECLSELHDKSVSLEAYELTTKELEQSLAEKAKELEDCLMKLQEVSTALDASEISKEELVKSETLVASYQEMLSQRNAFIENLEAILSQLEIPEEFQSVDILDKIRWLAEERKMLRDVSEEYNRLKDSILQIDLPEEISESNLETRFDCLKESLFRSKADVSQLQYQIESLTTSLSAEIQEKDKIRMELDDVASKLNEMEENVHQVSLEKDRIVKKLVETSGLVAEGGAHNTSSDIFVDKSFEKIAERIRDSGDSSFIDGELFETIQRLLYVRDLELSLCQDILGEDILVRSQVSNLSNQLKVASQELASAKEENSVIEKDLERVEEKSSLLREKLSMAIKKGKGLVQDRENLKNQLEEKNSEINKLKLELEHIRELDAELMAVKDEKDHLEQSLSQSNAMLDKVIRLVDSITIPVDITSEDPSEKIDRLFLYFKELEKQKEEADTLTSKLEETYASLKSVEDALSVAEDDINRLSEENRLLQAAKENVELELQKAVEDTSSLTGRLDEAFATSKSFEEALRQAERNISDIITEKEEAQSCAAAAEMELEKVRQEALIQTNKLTEAHGTIESLENALSQAENNIQLLSKQFDDDKEVRKNLENELKKLKDDADFQSTKMTEASMTIRSLEETLMKAEESHSALEEEKLKAEVEISTLSSKLNACMEELTGVSGNSQSRSLEIIDHLDNLQMLLKDDSLVSKVNEFLDRKFRSIKDMELIVRDIRKHLAKKVLVAEELDNATEDNSIVAKPLLNGLGNSVNIGLENSEESVAGEDEISSCLRKIADGVKMRNEILENNFESFSTSLDLLVAALLENLTAARNDVINVLADHESLRENERSMEIIVQDQENTISTLRDNVSALISACGEAVRELDLEVKNNLLDLENFSMLQFQENETCGENEPREHLQGLDDSECIQRVKALSSATAKACTTIKCFEKTSSAAAILIREMEDKLNETSVALEKVVEERDLNHNKVLTLEVDAKFFEALCRELKLQLEDFKAKEEKWHEKEKEFSSLYDKLMVKEQEAKDSLISAADIRALFDKMNGIELPSTDLANGVVDPQHPYDVKKLFYLVDCVSEMQNQLDLLSYKKDELESTLAEKAREIQSLKDVTEVQSAAGPELEKAKAELSVVITGLSKLLGILTGNDHLVESKSAESWALLQALEKHTTSLLLESEGSKSKVQELGLKLIGSQKLVDELSSKVKTLEDKLQSRAVQADVVQERSILEAPSSSEISEIDDMGSMAKSSGLAAPSAAQVRTLRKGSAEHLAISIDSESEHLMNHNDADEDKGHVFKSLNMSGLIPKQGKMIADRVDGIWVSGGRVLMSRPRARLGVITYCLLVHLWLLASIL